MPRTYVNVRTVNVDADSVASALRAGRVVLGNGPFVELTVAGAGPGDTVIVDPGTVTAHLRVIAPGWVDVNRVSVFVNGVEESVYMVRGRDRPLRFDEDVELRVEGPAWVTARADGGGWFAPLSPVPGGIRLSRKPICVCGPLRLEISDPPR